MKRVKIHECVVRLYNADKVPGCWVQREGGRREVGRQDWNYWVEHYLENYNQTSGRTGGVQRGHPFPAEGGKTRAGDGEKGVTTSKVAAQNRKN